LHKAASTVEFGVHSCFNLQNDASGGSGVQARHHVSANGEFRSSRGGKKPVRGDRGDAARVIQVSLSGDVRPGDFVDRIVRVEHSGRRACGGWVADFVLCPALFREIARVRREQNVGRKVSGVGEDDHGERGLRGPGGNAEFNPGNAVLRELRGHRAQSRGAAQEVKQIVAAVKRHGVHLDEGIRSGDSESRANRVPEFDKSIVSPDVACTVAVRFDALHSSVFIGATAYIALALTVAASQGHLFPRQVEKELGTGQFRGAGHRPRGGTRKNPGSGGIGSAGASSRLQLCAE